MQIINKVRNDCIVSVFIVMIERVQQSFGSTSHTAYMKLRSLQGDIACLREWLLRFYFAFSSVFPIFDEHKTTSCT